MPPARRAIFAAALAASASTRALAQTPGTAATSGSLVTPVTSVTPATPASPASPASPSAPAVAPPAPAVTPPAPAATTTPATGAATPTSAAPGASEPPPGGAAASVPPAPPAPTRVTPPPARPAPNAGTPATVTARPGQGFTLRSNDGNYSLNVRGVIAVRETLNINPNGRPATNELNIRRARLVFSGNIFSPNFQYYLALGTALFDAEIAPGAPLYEAYFNLGFLRDMNVRVGQMFIPHSRLSLTSISNLELVERPFLYRELNTDRDIGVMLFSNNFLGLDRLQYHAGVFSGEGLPASPPTNAMGQPIGFAALSTVPGFLYVFRLQATPLGAYEDVYSEADLSRSGRVRWSVGVSGAYNHNALRERSTQGQLGPSQMDYAHWTADTTLKVSGFSLAAEFLYREGYQAVSELLPATATPGYQQTDRVPFINRSLVAYYAQAGFMATPNFGLSLRWEHAIALPDTDPALVRGLQAQGYAVTGGLSYYFIQHFLKVQFDYSYRFGPQNLDDGQHVLRLQAQTFL